MPREKTKFKYKCCEPLRENLVRSDKLNGDCIAKIIINGKLYGRSHYIKLSPYCILVLLATVAFLYRLWLVGDAGEQ